MIKGEKASETGNRFARFSRRDDGLFDLELRLPEALAHLADETRKVSGNSLHIVRFKYLRFSHEADLLEAAISGKTPVSVRFHRDETGWRVMASFKVVPNEVSEDYRSGAVGVDLNAGFVSVTRADRHGNVIESFDFPMVTYGKSQSQSLDAVRKAAATVADYAATRRLPSADQSRLHQFDRTREVRSPLWLERPPCRCPCHRPSGDATERNAPPVVREEASRDASIERRPPAHSRTTREEGPRPVASRRIETCLVGLEGGADGVQGCACSARAVGTEETVPIRHGMERASLRGPQEATGCSPSRHPVTGTTGCP
jgi:hypothetical protein